MKKIVLLFVSLICALPHVLNAAGPGPEIKLSKSFDEPLNGSTRLLLMKNGNTILLHFMFKGGIRISIYDNEGVMTKTKVITGKEWSEDELRESELPGLLEINGDVVIFLTQKVHKRPNLFRIVIDAKTGNVKKEESLAELHKLNMFNSMEMMKTPSPNIEFMVEKDPGSDYYAVSIFDKLVGKQEARLQIVHYDPMHKEINRAYYNTPEGSYKHIENLGMYVQKDEFVFVVTGGHFATVTHMADDRMIISRLDKGEKLFKHKILNDIDGLYDLRVAVKYDAAEQTLQMLTVASVEGRVNNKRFTSTAMLHAIDPAQLTVKHKCFLKNKYASSYANANLGSKEKNYMGVPQNFNINADHSITVMSEEMEVKVRGAAADKGRPSMITDLDNIAISRYDKMGEELDGFAVAKKQGIFGAMYPLFHYKKNHGEWGFRSGNIIQAGMSSDNAFFSYEYMQGDDAEYVFFNDYMKNTEGKRSENNKKTVAYIKDANAICYMRKNNQVEKFYLFGDPKETDLARFIHLEGVAKSEDQKTMAAMMVENVGRRKKAYIAWIKF
jgi:hypothetical protein